MQEIASSGAHPKAPIYGVLIAPRLLAWEIPLELSSLHAMREALSKGVEMDF